ncbi:MAG: YibE/F family protein [Clostridia bacterium]|nr:YibE/F family protein [Clostridia bacterium]
MNILKKILPYILIFIVLGGVFAVWKTNPINYEMYRTDTISYAKAKVTAVNSQQIEESEDLSGRMKGVQNITVEFTEGERKGKSVTFDNLLSDTHSIDVKTGTKVIVKCDEPENVEPYYTVYQYDRSVAIIIAFGIFFALICIVGKTKGLRAGIALLVSMIVIAFGMLPAVYNGKSPIIVTFIVCVAISAVTLILLNGFSLKTAVAVLSTEIGLLASVLLYALVAEILIVTGYALEETEELILISRHTGLKVSDIMFSGILLGSLGAVMDTAMSIASSLFEIVENNPNIKGNKLFESGMNIGGDMIGTMCQTLVLAFTGGSVASLLVMLSYGTRFNQFLSSDFLAAEILQALTGSFAVILTVPITAFFSSLIRKAMHK